jgi:hypothetical protein
MGVGPGRGGAEEGSSAAELADELLALGDALLLDPGGDLLGFLFLAGEDGRHELGLARLLERVPALDEGLELRFLAGGRLSLLTSIVTSDSRAALSWVRRSVNSLAPAKGEARQARAAKATAARCLLMGVAPWFRWMDAGGRRAGFGALLYFVCRNADLSRAGAARLIWIK